jgi:hypothetical protein
MIIRPVACGKSQLLLKTVDERLVGIALRVCDCIVISVVSLAQSLGQNFSLAYGKGSTCSRVIHNSAVLRVSDGLVVSAVSLTHQVWQRTGFFSAYPRYRISVVMSGGITFGATITSGIRTPPFAWDGTM